MSADDDFVKKQAKLDQDVTLITDNLPPMWRNLYTKCIKEGFTEKQSFELLKTFIQRPV